VGFFLYRALEALLGALCRYYHGEFNRVAPAITTSLSRLTAGQPTAGELDTLRSFKNTMNEFQSRVDGVRRALMATLNNEEDLRLLYLSKLHEDRSLLGNVWSYDSEEAEVLIENYLQEIYALQTNATLMQQRIQNTETVVKLRLDAMRNYLLGTNILFSVAGISISLGTFVAGVFGMNLVSGVEEAHGWFLAVTASSVVLMGVSGWVTVRFFKRKGIFGSIQQVKSLTDKKRVTSDSPVKKTDTA
jgi:magnesium transporter